jgi:hypothetical protein
VEQAQRFHLFRFTARIPQRKQDRHPLVRSHARRNPRPAPPNAASSAACQPVEARKITSPRPMQTKQPSMREQKGIV